MGTNRTFNFELLYDGINLRQYLVRYTFDIQKDFSLSKEQIEAYLNNENYSFPRGFSSSVAYVGCGFFILHVNDD